MRSFTLLSLATAALAAPSLVERSPAGCQSTYDGTFEITVFKTAAAKRDLERRAGCTSDEGALILTLNGGNLKDKKGRTGYIADNRQFQFDGPVQAGAIKSSGFSVCTNGSLALDDSTVWYQCLSGNFYNLYDRHWAPQCEEVTIVAMSCGDGGSVGPVGQTSDGQPQATTAVTQIGDGQVQAPTKVPVITQIGDGQIQAPTGAPVTQIGDGQIQVPSSIAPKPTGAPVTQIGDGQVQAPTKIATKAPVTQISDGQVQAPTGAPVTQIGDGQVQAPTGAPVTQIGDGQVQAPTGAPVTQIGDGQVQAPTSVGTIQPTTVPSPSVSLLPPSAGSQILPGSFALIVAALGAVFAL